MTKRKNISKVSHYIQELMTISMEYLPLEVFSESLYPDILICVSAVFISHRCESGPGRLTHDDRLKDCSDGTSSQWFY